MTESRTFAERYDLLAQAVAACERITAEAMPEPYRELLVHASHMTVTLETYFRQSVMVEVLQSLVDGDEYGRQILLRLQDSGRVVQFGVVQINLNVLPPHVREEIISERTPLGRVLIQNGVLTRVEPMAYLALNANADFAKWFSVAVGTKLYGRIGVIFAGDEAAIEVLEVLAPIG
ncbi:hypothetical protein BH11PLA2_BH11PLA2_42360 [soil metagenome]